MVEYGFIIFISIVIGIVTIITTSGIAEIFVNYKLMDEYNCDKVSFTDDITASYNRFSCGIPRINFDTHFLCIREDWANGLLNNTDCEVIKYKD